MYSNHDNDDDHTDAEGWLELAGFISAQRSKSLTLTILKGLFFHPSPDAQKYSPELFLFLSGSKTATSRLAGALVCDGAARQNPFYVLQFAETAATNEEFAMALQKMYFGTMEVTERDEDGDRDNDDESFHYAESGAPSAILPILS